MNLIQVQERLKGLPPGPQTVQILTAYANGMNPDIPPYVALGELERRKRLDEEAKRIEPPTGTVKDQIEQQAGLAALQQMRMGQAQQQMMQGAAAQPMPVPEGAPQPEMQPEEAGIANAAAQPGVMQPGVMRMAGGGIVAFAEGGDSEDDEDEDDDTEDTGEEDESTLGAGYGGLETGEGQFPAETYAVTPQPQIQSRPLPPQTEGGIVGPGLRLPPQAPSTAQSAPAPQGPQTIPQQRQGLQALMAARRAAVPQAPVIATRESMAKENPELYGVLNKPIGKDYLAGLEALMAKRGALDPEAVKQLEANKRMDLWRAFSAYGQASRGQKGLGGIGALAESLGRSMEARGQEELGIKQRALKDEELLNKARYDVEGLQRAQANNDLKGVNTERMKLYDTAAKLYASGNISAARELAAIAGIEMRQIAAAAQVEAAKIRAAAKGAGAGAGAKKITDEREGVEDFYQARLARGEPPGPETRVKARQDYARTKGVASLESTSARRDRDIAEMLKTAEAMAFGELGNMSEAEKRVWRANKRKEIEADYEAGRYRMQRIPEAPGAAPAAKAPPLPPGFVPR